jgi:hypothetical protein
MNTSRKTKSQQTWLFDGKPEFVDVNVAATTPMEGGYVVAMELTTGSIHLAATRHPAKYVSAWRYNVRRYGVPDIIRVLVSHPYLRYEAIKRGLSSLLADYKDTDSEAFLLGIDVLTAKACEMFAAVSLTTRRPQTSTGHPSRPANRVASKK